MARTQKSLHLDDDIVDFLRDASEKTNKSMSQIVNDTIRDTGQVGRQ
jgi:hypothetical protein